MPLSGGIAAAVGGAAGGDILIRLLLDGKQYQAGLAAARAQAQGFSSRMISAGRTMQSVGSTMTRRFTLPLVLAGGAAVKLAVDFNESMTHIKALVGASDAQISRYHDTILDMAGAVGKSPQELAEALYFVTSAGFSGAKALDVLDASARASAAGLGETMTVADAVTSAVNAYGEKVLSAEQATDILLATVREGKAEPEELAGSIGRVIPVASDLGVSFDEVGAALAGMTLSGFNAAEAATNLGGIFSSLLKPTTKGDEVLKSLGLTLDDVRAMVEDEGLFPALMMLREELGNDKEAMASLFPNVRALRGFLNLTGASAEKNAGVFRDLSGAVGDTDKAFQDIQEDPAHKFREAWSDVQATMIEAGEKILPVVTKIIEEVGGIVGAFGNLDEGTQEFIIWAGAITAAAGPAVNLLGNLLRIGGRLGRMKFPIPGGTGGAGGGVGAIPFLATGPGGLAIATTLTAVTAGIYNIGQAAQDKTQFINAMSQALLAGHMNTRQLREELMRMRMTEGPIRGLYDQVALMDNIVAQANVSILDQSRNLRRLGIELTDAELAAYQNYVVQGDLYGQMVVLNGALQRGLGPLNNLVGSHRSAAAAAADHAQKVQGLGAAMRNVPDASPKINFPSIDDDLAKLGRLRGELNTLDGQKATITVHTNYTRSGTPPGGIPGGTPGGAGGHQAQHGWHGWVHGPTWFLTGEGGQSERVDISPKNSVHGPVAGGKGAAAAALSPLRFSGTLTGKLSTPLGLADFEGMAELAAEAVGADVLSAASSMVEQQVWAGMRR